MLPSARPSVLVVDDNEANRLLGCACLEAIGCQSCSVPCGEKAIEAYKEFAPVAVLMDFDLPGCNGIEALRRIRALEAELHRDSVPVVLWTACHRHQLEKTWQAAGGNGVLGKPFQIAELIAVLAEGAVHKSDVSKQQGASPML